MVTKKEEVIYLDMEELEGNMYEEFKEIVEEVSTSINEKILSSKVFNPLDETLKKYEYQLLKVTGSIDKVEQVSKHLDATKAGLSKSIEKTIKTVSKQIIEDVILMKVEEVVKKYEIESKSIAYQSNILKNILFDMTKIEQEIIPAVSEALESKMEKILEEKVLYKFEELYEKSFKQLSSLLSNNKEAEKLLKNMETTRKDIHKDIHKSYEEISFKITEYISTELTGLYNNYSEQITVFESRNQDLQNTVRHLNKVIEETEERHEAHLRKFEETKEKIEKLEKQNNLTEQKIAKTARMQTILLAGIGLVNIGVLISVFI